ncbi:hypothetical protein FRC08_005704 [Ceratobasidium sp. 394]|nr:hypothetical protein FRC08_005704 [Ceratobasidium sp. 394]KAG9091508.1 hypothetical protein FS749_016485 [Ceratobasidium sp. UAMH 11750]
MHFSVTTALSALALLASGAQAAHVLTLHNNCGRDVALTLNNWSGTPYNGPPIGTIHSKDSKKITVPDGWDGRICESTGGCGGSGKCFGKCSMVEFNMNSNGLNYYDISNIQAFTMAQKIAAGSGCNTVTCGGANCPCKQAYRPGDISGTCGGTGPKDQGK